jgi:hypothetical protein
MKVTLLAGTVVRAGVIILLRLPLPDFQNLNVSFFLPLYVT